jgi:DHA2 family multidrug resistance protein
MCASTAGEISAQAQRRNHDDVDVKPLGAAVGTHRSAVGFGRKKMSQPSARTIPLVNPWIIAVIVSMATFMEVLDTSIANVALQHIAGGLAAGLDESTWVLTSYLVSNAIILPMSGWLSTRIGRKKFYMICVALFTVSSFMCGIAPSLAFLLTARVFQGLGGGGLAPSEQAILTDSFPPNKRGQAFALYGIAVVVAPALGPALGGWITDSFSWRWIFFINIPVGLLSLFLTYHYVPEADSSKDAKSRKSIDYLGFALVALGLGCMQVVLDRGQIDDWFGSPLIVAFTIISGCSIALLIIHELTVQDPVVDLPLLKNPSFFICNVVMFLLGIVLFGTTQLLPQMTQDLFGYDATKAGLTLSPGGMVVFACMPVVGFLVNKVQPKYLIMFGFLTTGLALWSWTNLYTQVSFKVLVEARMFQAVGLAFLFVPINTLAYSGLPKGKSNDASALINLMRNLGGSVGISIVQTMLSRRSQFHQARLVEHVTNGNPIYYQVTHGTGNGHATLRQIFTTISQQAEMLSFIDIFKVLAIAAFISIPVVIFMKRIKLGEKTEAAH